MGDKTCVVHLLMPEDMTVRELLKLRFLIYRLQHKTRASIQLIDWDFGGPRP